MKIWLPQEVRESRRPPWRKHFLVLFTLFFLILPGIAQAREITLFDREGTPVAYIDTNEQLTVFLWNGTPVAYLDNSSIYGYNGKFLGWFKYGIIRDREGYAVGFVSGAVNMLTKMEPLKSLQELVPLRSLQELEPIEPIFQNIWSSIPLESFLTQGRQ